MGWLETENLPDYPDDYSNERLEPERPTLHAYCGKCKTETLHVMHRDSWVFWLCLGCGRRINVTINGGNWR